MVDLYTAKFLGPTNTQGARVKISTVGYTREKTVTLNKDSRRGLDWNQQIKEYFKKELKLKVRRMIAKGNTTYIIVE